MASLYSLDKDVLVARLEAVINALEHAITMMEYSRDCYGDPALFFELDFYRGVVSEAKKDPTQ